jgi:hypothetical protein
MNDITHFKLEIFIPADRVDALREALGRVGAGQIGNYDRCCSVMEVRGYWRPLEGAKPFQGEVGQVETGTECKVEVNCPRELVRETIKAIRAVHPYEEPVINILPLANHLFTGE